MSEQEFVAEIMGVWANAGPGRWVELRHTTAGIEITVNGSATLTPVQARRLARLLQDAAARYEAAAKLSASAVAPLKVAR